MPQPQNKASPAADPAPRACRQPQAARTRLFLYASATRSLAPPATEMRPLKDRGKPWTLRDVGSSYDYEKTVGEGVYGEVFQATEKYTKDARALKRVKTDNATEREGFPITALREANVLEEAFA